MATPIRKKRNFKALALDVSQPAPEPASEPLPVEPVATRLAPTAGGKKRPAPIALKAPKIPSDSGQPATDADGNALAVDDGSNSAPANASARAARRMTYKTSLYDTIAKMEGGELKIELRNEDFKDLHDLGQGNGGSVKKVEHIPTGLIMAKKIVLIDAKPAVRKQILRELKMLHECHSPYIVGSYGAFLADPNICICMELMDKGSFDSIYKKIGAIDIEVVSKVALAVLEGLTYLYDVHRIIHRDIKPSNMLFNSHGNIKICDFGVSGELINSIADTFVGTSTYMSPERIQGAQYTVKSDVWSLGISLIELALGRFPFSESDSDDSDLSDFESTLSPSNIRPPSTVGLPPPRTKAKKDNDDVKKDRRKSKGVSLQGGAMTMSILELLQHIVNEPAPRLVPEDKFPPEASAFVDACLLKDPEQRKTPQELLQHPWIDIARASELNLKDWASTF